MRENKLDTITNLFEGSEIRSIWDSEKQDYYFSVVDVISALTNANIPRNYWSDLKRKLKEEGSELHEKIVQLKMIALDGKNRQTDTLDTEGIFRLIESVPSPKAEPFKMWLASLGKERIDEVFDPEKAIDRAIDYYRKKGYSDSWIEVRLTGRKIPMKEPNAMSFHVKYKPEDFMPANEEEKQSQVIMRESVGFWQDGFRRLRKNKVAMVSLFVIIVVMIFSFIVPAFYPYDYKTQIKGSENLHPMQYSEKEIERMDAGEKVFPHVLGTDKMGRDYAIRVMMGSRISLLVGLIATAIIFVIGSLIGSISAFFGGWVDLIIMRIVDIIYTIPDFLLIVLLSFALKDPLANLAQLPGFGWMQIVGSNLISIFIVFALLYWVGMARMVRSQILTLKENDYVMAAKALGAKDGRIIKKHLLTNCIGTLIVTTTLQIPSSIFTESYLSFLGMGVAVPLPSLGSLASDAINGMITFPYLLFAPCLLISLIILSFNLFGDGLRDAFDPKLKN